MSSSLANANFGGPSSNGTNSASGTAGGRLTRVRTFCLFLGTWLKVGATVGLAPLNWLKLGATPPPADEEIVSD